MKKVLMLANHELGIYKFRRELIEKMIKEGYEVYISLPYGPKVEYLKKIGCKFIDTNINRRNTNPIEDIKLFIDYIKILNKVKPDMVLTYTIKPNLYGGIACRLKKIPYICNVTGLGSGYLNSGIIYNVIHILSKLSFRKANKVFFQNIIDMELLIKQKVVNENYELLPGSGVNLNDYKILPYPLEDKPIHFNFIARVMKDKGIDEYLEAAKIIKEDYKNTVFNVIGSIEEPYYKDILEDYEKKGIIRYHGFQNDLTQFIQQSSCTINPSYTEGMSNVLLESAASGRPIIASNIPGCREIIKEDKTGYTFRVKDTEDLVYKIKKFINLTYKDKVKMGIEGRYKVEQEFDRQIVVDTYLYEINNIITECE